MDIHSTRHASAAPSTFETDIYLRMSYPQTSRTAYFKTKYHFFVCVEHFGLPTAVTLSLLAQAVNWVDSPSTATTNPATAKIFSSPTHKFDEPDCSRHLLAVYRSQQSVLIFTIFDDATIP